MNHPSVEGTNAGNRHSVQPYSLPQGGASVTRRVLFPGSCFPGGLGCSGACALPGLLAELFPFETQGRLEVGNVGPRSSHRCRATPARPQDGARPGAGTVRGQSEVRAGVPHATAALSTCLWANAPCLPRRAPQLRPAPLATSETGQGTLASGPGAVPRPQLSSSLACTGHSVLGRPCHGWGSESPDYAVPQGEAGVGGVGGGGRGRQPSHDHTPAPGPHRVPPECVGHGVVKEQWCRLHVGSAVHGEWPVTEGLPRAPWAASVRVVDSRHPLPASWGTPVRSLGTWGAGVGLPPALNPRLAPAQVGGWAGAEAGGRGGLWGLRMGGGKQEGLGCWSRPWWALRAG